MKIYIACLQIMEKEDRIYRLTTIEIAKAQKKDHQVYSKKIQKHKNWIGIFNLLIT
jgi:hypothetical protein